MKDSDCGATTSHATSSPGRFSPQSKAREKRPGDEVALLVISLEFFASVPRTSFRSDFGGRVKIKRKKDVRTGR